MLWPLAWALQSKSLRGSPWLPWEGGLWGPGSKQSPSCLRYPKCASQCLQEAILPQMRIQDPVLWPLRSGLLEAFGIQLAHPICM